MGDDVAEQQAEHGNLAQLTPYHAFGIATGETITIHHIDENTLLYPVGQHVVMHNTSTNEMIFIVPDPAVKQLVCTAVSANKKYLALSEVTNDNHGQITVVNLIHNRRIRVLKYSTLRMFVAVDFSHDSRYLVGVGGPTEYTLVYFLWERTKVLSNVNIQNKITKAVFSPFDANSIITVGPKYLRLWRMVRGELKGFSALFNGTVQPVAGMIYTGVVWFHGETFCVSTDRGAIYIFDAGECTAQVDVFPTPINCMLSYRNGLVASGGGKVFKLFESDYGGERLALKKTATCNLDSARYDDQVIDMSLSPSGATLCAVTTSSQIVRVDLKLLDMDSEPSKDSDEVAFSLVSAGFHHGAITGMDICQRRPLIVTCGADRTVRVWNYLKRTCTNVQRFREEPYSVAFHPLGLHFLVAFNEGVSLVSVLVNGYRVEHVFQRKYCKCVRFSNTGSYFAAVAGNIVYLHATYSFEEVGQLVGHVRPVRSVAWYPDDFGLITVGSDGTVYEWSAQTMERLHETMFRECDGSDVVCPTGRSAVVTGTDKMIREMQNGMLSVEYKAHTAISKLAVAVQDHLLFGSSKSTGVVRIFSFPHDVTDHQEIITHQGGVANICVSPDGSLLFTGGLDGVIFIQYVRPYVKGVSRDIRLPPPENFSDLMLTTAVHIDDLLFTIKDLEKKVEDTNSNAEYQIRIVRRTYEKQIQELQDQNKNDKLEGAASYQGLQSEAELRQREFNAEKKALIEQRKREGEQLVKAHKAELDRQEKRFREYEQDMNDKITSYEDQLKQQQQQHANILARMKADYEKNLNEQMRAFDKLVDEMEMTELEHAEILRQIDDDFDDEMLQMKMYADKELDEAHMATMKEKEEQALLKMQHNDNLKEKDQLKLTTHELRARIVGLEGKAEDANRRIAMLRREVQERDEIIADKEIRITETKKRNKDLEKFKFVLEWKNKELAQELEPKKEAIHEMAQKLNEMDDEKRRLKQESDNMALQIKEREQKLGALRRELTDLRLRLKAKDRIVEAMERDVHELYTKTPMSKWREGVRHLYQTYVSQATHSILAAAAGDEKKLEEFGRQRMFMEQSIHKLRQQHLVNEEVWKAEMLKKNTENHELVGQLNELRREKKHLTKEVSNLRSDIATLKLGLRTASRVPSPPPHDSVAESTEFEEDYRFAEGARRDDDTRPSTAEPVSVPNSAAEVTIAELEAGRAAVSRIREEAQALVRQYEQGLERPRTSAGVAPEGYRIPGAPRDDGARPGTVGPGPRGARGGLARRRSVSAQGRKRPATAGGSRK